MYLEEKQLCFDEGSVNDVTPRSAFLEEIPTLGLSEPKRGHLMKITYS